MLGCTFNLVDRSALHVLDWRLRLLVSLREARHSRIHPGFQPEGAEEFFNNGFGKLLLVDPTEV